MSETSSTKTEPLKFFYHFLLRKEIDKFEKQFYEYPINPSQIKNKSQGYIEYTLPIYETGESEKKRVYFSKELEKMLNAHTDISLEFIRRHKKERAYLNDFENKFIDLELNKLAVLIKDAHKLPHSDIIIRKLESLFNAITEIRSSYIINKHKPRKEIVEGLNPYFGNKKGTNEKLLSEIFSILVDIQFIDEDITTEEDFIGVLTNPNPANTIFSIQFKEKNIPTIYLLKLLQDFFLDFSWSKISKSKSFKSKQGTVFTQQALDKYENNLKNRDTSNLNYIDKALSSIS